jgi:hypothetical protein
MDETGTATGFVLWITREDGGRISGTVERVRTGERHRFRELEALGALIDRMLPRGDEAAGTHGRATGEEPTR